MNGTINLFKPKGITSHDAVYKIRRILGIKKVGHTGTLDPNAGGVLPICMGKGTRISEYLLEAPKEYIAELTLGLATDTQDMDGKIINYSTKRVCEAEIYNAFRKHIGETEQIPPMYSALKHKGKKLYELARSGIVIERPSRKINIYYLNILNLIDNKKVLFSIKCSRGTYIRALCHDIGEELGTYGYMSYLIRTSVGDFQIKNSYSIEYLEALNKDRLNKVICPIGDSINHLDAIHIERESFNRLTNGQIVPLRNAKHHEEYEPIRVYCENTFIGIGRIIYNEQTRSIKMDKVLI